MSMKNNTVFQERTEITYPSNILSRMNHLNPSFKTKVSGLRLKTSGWDFLRRPTMRARTWLHNDSSTEPEDFFHSSENILDGSTGPFKHHIQMLQQMVAISGANTSKQCIPNPSPLFLSWNQSTFQLWRVISLPIHDLKDPVRNRPIRLIWKHQEDLRLKIYIFELDKNSLLKDYKIEQLFFLILKILFLLFVNAHIFKNLLKIHKLLMQ